jgi:predicted NBD/HSP70 family sugar kinase
MRAIVLNELNEVKLAETLKNAVGNLAPNEDWNAVAKQIADAVKEATGENPVADAVAIAVGATEGPFPADSGEPEFTGEELEQEHDDAVRAILRNGYRPYPADNGVACLKCGDTEVKGFFREESDVADEHVEWLCHSCGAVYNTATKDA